MATLKNDLARHNLSLEDAIELALNKPLWRLLAASGATHWWCMPNNDDESQWKEGFGAQVQSIPVVPCNSNSDFFQKPEFCLDIPLDCSAVLCFAVFWCGQELPRTFEALFEGNHYYVVEKLDTESFGLLARLLDSKVITLSQKRHIEVNIFRSCINLLVSVCEIYRR